MKKQNESKRVKQVTDSHRERKQVAQLRQRIAFLSSKRNKSELGELRELRYKRRFGRMYWYGYKPIPMQKKLIEHFFGY